jgi:alpha-galactosidase
MERRRVEIAYIGGGSRNWAPKLLADLALEGELEGELRLYDIDHEAARHNESLAAALFSHPAARGGFSARATASAAEALAGADFVVVSIEPGPIEARYADLVIPARHGVLQTVGDTTGPGGILRSLRSWEAMEGYARLVMDTCPEAWVINYTNPMSFCVAALHAAAPGIKAHGCCHEVFGTQERLAALLGADQGTAPPDRREIELDFAGVNHFTLATAASWKGRDLMPLARAEAEAMDPGLDRSEAALRRRAEERWFDSDGAVAYDFLLRLGTLGAAGDRHLAEFVPWYLGKEADILAMGVPPTPYEWRLRNWSGPRPGPGEYLARPLLPSGEEGVAQMKALAGLGPFRTNLNLPNRGQWSQVQSGTVVETRALVDRGRIEGLEASPLPRPALELQRRIIAEQALVLEAARTRDPALVLEALLLDPLVRLPPRRAEAMLREMLAHAAPWLPGWKLPG